MVSKTPIKKLFQGVWCLWWNAKSQSSYLPAVYIPKESSKSFRKLRQARLLFLSGVNSTGQHSAKYLLQGRGKRVSFIEAAFIRVTLNRLLRTGTVQLWWTIQRLMSSKNKKCPPFFLIFLLSSRPFCLKAFLFSEYFKSLKSEKREQYYINQNTGVEFKGEPIPEFRLI